MPYAIQNQPLVLRDDDTKDLSKKEIGDFFEHGFWKFQDRLYALRRSHGISADEEKEMVFMLEALIAAKKTASRRRS